MIASVPQLLRLARDFAAHRELSLSRVSWFVQGNGTFFKGLEQRKDCQISTSQKALRWFDDNWPMDLEWPSDIPRPSKTEGKAA